MSFAYQDSLVTIGAIAFDPMINFYRQLLAQDPEPYERGIYGEFRLNTLRLAIFKPKSDHQANFTTSAGSGLSLCLQVVDLEQAIAHLRAIGHPAQQPIITASHGREVYLYDPGNNRIILYESTKSE
jgi:hypothetical protein